MKESTTSGWVQQFAEYMEQKLSENRHKGDRPGWLKNTPEQLLQRVEEELLEVKNAIKNGDSTKNVWREAADVSNMIGMVADSYEHRKEWMSSTPAEISLREFTRMVHQEFAWTHEDWRIAAVDFMRYHVGPLNGTLRVLVETSFAGQEVYSDRLWRNAARIALGQTKG